MKTLTHTFLLGACVLFAGKTFAQEQRDASGRIMPAQRNIEAVCAIIQTNTPTIDITTASWFISDNCGGCMSQMPITITCESCSAAYNGKFFIAYTVSRAPDTYTVTITDAIVCSQTCVFVGNDEPWCTHCGKTCPGGHVFETKVDYPVLIYEPSSILVPIFETNKISSTKVQDTFGAVILAETPHNKKEPVKNSRPNQMACVIPAGSSRNRSENNS